MDGGYEDGYRACKCFWGRKPGRLLSVLEDHLIDFGGLRVLDAGCGEGKNAIALARKGAKVLAVDISQIAIDNAKRAWKDASLVQWQVADIRTIGFRLESFDLIIAYGLLHCLSSEAESIKLVEIFRRATKRGGYNIICAFNSRRQELVAHPGFHPLLLSHSQYVKMYKGWECIFASDEDLTEVHPHNNLEHTHSMTRMLMKKELT